MNSQELYNLNSFGIMSNELLLSSAIEAIPMMHCNMTLPMLCGCEITPVCLVSKYDIIAMPVLADELLLKGKNGDKKDISFNLVSGPISI